MTPHSDTAAAAVLRRRGPVSRTPLHEQVADLLRGQIVTGRLAPGERLQLTELARQLEVSLTPMREALKILAEEQLIELTPNRPTRVAPVTVADTRALFEVMAGIESQAAELAAQRMTPADLARLEALHAEMLQCFRQRDNEAYFALNSQLHDLIADSAGNPILSHVRAKLSLLARRVRFVAVNDGSRREAALQEHEQVMAAFRAGDPDAARRAWRIHLLNSGDEVCRILAVRGQSLPEQKEPTRHA
ncbi:GntR family transcriptional regulator [Leisingera daeponensis]|uniref:GntR family transcriptional regulator n=1 Tax=Leisingera daeponensis TaxID=405746 RepID=A0ABS7NMN0_9RHOB|nr:GntR family transcriptional regulator [Leisingera daeponensis]MBY6142196.1 GntR family transcriptional regulator [Leisingera daeponensis]